ncbi:MAG: hypothetical protein H6672_02115 [Anaerolineaceae bacterium]|nr:hypothetical protein [Anaerolineaceae bacterium]
MPSGEGTNLNQIIINVFPQTAIYASSFGQVTLFWIAHQADFSYPEVAGHLG